MRTKTGTRPAGGEDRLLRRFLLIFKRASLRKKDLLILGAVQLLMVAALFTWFRHRPDFDTLRTERLQSTGGQMVIIFLVTILVLQVSFLLYLTYLFFRYKTIKSVSDELLPTCTVIVPAYNEGSLVYHTLTSLCRSNYPANKLQIIAVDDGSADDTWDWIKKAKRDLGDRITIFQQPQNMGKRKALYRGFEKGTGDIFVTVDSDSIVNEETLRNLVSPFVINKNCGAVAGNVKVLNQKKGMIPRMLNVSFTFSFEFVRSAQSALGFVLCTPGALSAYRRKVVLNCLDKWIDQTFLGKSATIGEDRAMTNMILQQGYEVLFQRNAKVLTSTPTSYRTLHKMFTRWGRSNVRENMMMNRYIFGDFRKRGKTGPRIIYFNQWMRLLVAYPMIGLMLYYFIMHPFLYLVSVLTGTFIFSTIQVLFYAKRYKFIDAVWAYPYSVFYTFALFWITPYAIATVRNGGWLTRSLPVKKMPDVNTRILVRRNSSVIAVN